MSRPTPPTRTPIPESVQRLSRRLDQIGELLARLSGSAMPAAEFYQALTEKTLAAIHGVAGAVWLTSPQNILQLQHQTRLGDVGLDDRPDGRSLHGALLRHAVVSKQLIGLDPDCKLALPDGAHAGNPANCPIVAVPILGEQGDAVGAFEIFLDPSSDPKLKPIFMNFIANMSGYATNFLRHTSALRNTVQEQAFTQLEAFSRQIHASLNPTEVAFLVVNEGRRLIGCDRLSAGIRHGRSTTIEAVSGSDVVEKGSVQVKALRALVDSVLNWNERLVYQGARDASLPPAVLDALDDYLAQSNPKFLVLQPLRDERELVKTKDKEAKPGPARSALLLECFDPPATTDPLLERFNIVAGHAASALYNAAELKRIPFAFLWKPMRALQGAAGGKRRFYTKIALALLVLITLAMIFVPYPHKLDATGKLEPEEWSYIYPTGPGRIIQFKVAPGQVVRPNTPIAVLTDNELGSRITEKLGQIGVSERNVIQFGRDAVDPGLPPARRREKADELARERKLLANLNDQLNSLLEAHRADRANAGQFTVVAPEFRRARNASGAPIWKIVSADFEHQLVNRWVKPEEPLLQVGNTVGAWRIEQKIPQKYSSELSKAYKTDQPNEYLEVDVLVTSAPTQTFKGRLYRRDITGKAEQNKDDHNEPDPVVFAYVRVNDPDMPKEDHIPSHLLVTGVEVHTKIRCGERSLGYVLFHGAWEFFYEHVLFAF